MPENHDIQKDPGSHTWWLRFTASELHTLRGATARDYNRRLRNWRRKPETSRQKMGAQSSFALELAALKKIHDRILAAEKEHTEAMVNDINE